MTLTDAHLDLLPSEEDVRFYEEHGWWVSPPILTEDELEEARFGADRYYSGERDAVLLLDVGTDWTEARGNVLRQNDYVSLQIEELRMLAHHPLVAASAARLARTPEVRLFHDQLIWKPGPAKPEDTAVGWHTDIAYWKTVSSRNLITAWIPFQDIDDDMGPMLALDGSHRWEGNDKLEFFHKPDLEEIATHIATHGASMEPVPLAVELGTVSFHHCRTIHGSRPNLTDRPRVALAVHMQDAENRYVPNVDEKGHRQAHINDLLCRKDADGNPDYSDPDIFPVLWSEGEEAVS